MIHKDPAVIPVSFEDYISTSVLDFTSLTTLSKSLRVDND
jgi:hypothetical protein